MLMNNVRGRITEPAIAWELAQAELPCRNQAVKLAGRRIVLPVIGTLLRMQQRNFLEIQANQASDARRQAIEREDAIKDDPRIAALLHAMSRNIAPADPRSQAEIHDILALPAHESYKHEGKQYVAQVALAIGRGIVHYGGVRFKCEQQSPAHTQSSLNFIKTVHELMGTISDRGAITEVFEPGYYDLTRGPQYKPTTTIETKSELGYTVTERHSPEMMSLGLCGPTPVEWPKVEVLITPIQHA